MNELALEFEELRRRLERLRSLLENLVVRGLRACGKEEMLELSHHTGDLERAGAGHVAALLAELKNKVENDDRSAPASLVAAQTAVRLLDRALTLRVAKAAFERAEAIDTDANANGADARDDENDE